MEVVTPQVDVIKKTHQTSQLPLHLGPSSSLRPRRHEGVMKTNYCIVSLGVPWLCFEHVRKIAHIPQL